MPYLNVHEGCPAARRLQTVPLQVDASQEGRAAVPVLPNRALGRSEGKEDRMIWKGAFIGVGIAVYVCGLAIYFGAF